jgi:hypothetical protein
VSDEPERGLWRVDVRPDGARVRELVGPDHPVIGPLAALVEAELRSHIARVTLGVPGARVDLSRLDESAFSIAEEVDYYFELVERPDAQPTPAAARGAAVEVAPDEPGPTVADAVAGQLWTDLVVGMYGVSRDELDDDAVDAVVRSITAAIDERYVARAREERLQAAGGVSALPWGLFVLGVRRSGTTLLRVMLDRHPDLAVPDESYFIPQLARRHRGEKLDVEAFVDDLRRLPTLVEWGLSPDAVATRLEADMHPGQAIAAVFQAYAEERGKSSWGDKTPLYMEHLPLLERLFPVASHVHLIRDGRDAALSFLSVPEGIMTEGWGHPRDVAGFACQWATEVRAARALGDRRPYLEVRYEELVVDPERELRRVCRFLGLEYDAGMLGYVGQTESARKAHQQRLNEPPRVGVRDWRTEMSPADVAAFEAVAGDLLDELGYEVSTRGHGARQLAAYRVKTSAWRGVGALTQRSPLWRRRHGLLQTPGV